MGALTMMSYILYSWLIVGFLVGVKSVYVEQVNNGKNLEEIKKRMGDAQFEKVKHMYSNKNVIIMLTLFGYISLIVYILGKIKKLKNFLSKSK